MKTAEDLITEISLATRITREPRLLVLLSDLKEFLESQPPAHQEQAPLEPREGRTLSSEAKARKTEYMRQWMARKRQKDRDAKNAIINSTSNSDRATAEVVTSPQDQTCQAPETPPWEDE